MSYDQVVLALRLCLVGAMLLIVGACAGDDSTASPTPETHTITGAYVIGGLRCDEVAGSTFAAIPGVTITISDDQGNAVGSSKVGVRGLDSSDSSSCSFSFSVPNVPRSENYTIAAGAVGSVTYSYAELSSNNWNVTLRVSS